MILFKADKPIEKILYPIKYVVGRNNLALTIFVPYCTNSGCGGSGGCGGGGC